MVADAVELDELLRLAALRGNRDRFFAREVVRSEGAGLGQFAERAGEHEFAAGVATAGTDIDEIIGGADDGFLVFDHDQRVALVAQGVHDPDQLRGVARVQAHAGFVHDEERVDQRRAEAGGEVDALDLAAGE